MISQESHRKSRSGNSAMPPYGDIADYGVSFSER